MSTTRLLHVANGTSTTRTIEAAGLPGAVSIWADPLHEGPVPGGLSDAELIAVRQAFHASSPASRDPANDMRRWRDVIADTGAYDELVLWFEHDLFDQLALIQLLSWLQEAGLADRPATLICIGSFPGHPDFKGLGELTAAELAPLLETRQRVTGAQFALAVRAWAAFRSPTPEALDAFRQGELALGVDQDQRALPFLGAALTRLLQEYPWTRDGLGRFERRLLELAGEGLTLNAAFPRMNEGETAFYIPDTTLLDLALRLSSSPPPLITLTADERPFRRTLGLTSEGRAVLAGEQDFVALCGIDRWIGGVHLTGGAWRWDDQVRRVVLIG
jgi:hypothetical protein